MARNEKVFEFNPRKALEQASYWPRALRLIWAAAPRWTIAWAALLVVQGLLPVALVYLTKLLVDSFVAAINSGGDWGHTRHALIVLGLTAAVTLAVELVQSVIEWARAYQSELVQDHIKALIHKQSAAVDLAFYDSPDFHDSLDQARSEGGARPLALLENLGSLAQNGITLLAMALVLVPYSPWLPVILFLSTLPAFFVVLRFDRRYHRWWQRTTPDRRWAQYYDVMLTHNEAAAEMRMFGLNRNFQASYQALRKRLRAERLKQMQMQSLAKLGAAAAALLFTGVTMAWMVWRGLQGAITLGDLALLYQAFNRGQGLMRSMLGSLGQVYTNSLYLGNLFSFLELKPTIKDPPRPVPTPFDLKKGISFNRVTFHYPNSERAALRDFSLHIPAGKVVAIVGANGAGKSTLLKLLCRFYDPQSGNIEIDGRDIRDFSVDDLRRAMTIMFQFPHRYHATARQNIAYGDLESTHDHIDIETAARDAGAHELITRLPKGYDTPLGTLFADGVQLSGGEWQRVALARAYLRRSPIILLDEPTSLMDSWAEAEWIKRFHRLAEGRTAIIITHRLTIAVRAHYIHVMQGGEITESGSHHELLARGGLYARSWTSQMNSQPDTMAETEASAYTQTYDNITI